jgi:hypothetical protein
MGIGHAWVSGFPFRLGGPDRDDFAASMFHSTVGIARPRKFVFPVWIFLPLARWNGVNSAA